MLVPASIFLHSTKLPYLTGEPLLQDSRRSLVSGFQGQSPATDLQMKRKILNDTVRTEE